MSANELPIDEVAVVIARTIGIDARARAMNASTPLFGSMPELDSFGVVELIAALEDHFGFQIDDDDFSGDMFETVGTLAAFVARKTATDDASPVIAENRRPALVD